MLGICKRLLIYFLGIAITYTIAGSSPSFAYEHEIKILSTSIADHIAEAGKKRIAVVDFTDLQGNITELGRFLAEELSVDLTNTAKGFEVIDRNHLNRILAEHKLSVSGIVDQKTVQKLGQIAGVDALITGSITPLERSVRVVCKVIATDTARVISAAKGDIPKTKAIEELFGKGIETMGISSSQTMTAKSMPQSLHKVEVQNFLFEIQGCKASSKGIACDLLITNKEEKDRNLTIYGTNSDSKMVDDLGNEYTANYVRLGNKETSSNQVDNLLVSGIPTKAGILFEDVSQGARKVAVLFLDCQDKNNGKYKYFSVSLRNIPLSR